MPVGYVRVAEGPLGRDWLWAYATLAGAAPPVEEVMIVPFLPASDPSGSGDHDLIDEL
jgi:hypothetical protein